ncbi:MAG: UvrD-helicase domain-containing protein [Firmicutes bacterium]|nr:UvrD-helicase domain-containing protein [Bacillota bacterium]
MNLDHLNDKQREAVLHTEGPLLILAGAGSGKTATMTHRIAYLIEQGVSPYKIMAVTFTNKAATEMRERVEKLVGSVPGMWILTFHSMSLRILREHYEEVGYERNFVIYDTVDQKALYKSILKDLNIDTKEYPINYLSAIISKEKEADRGPEEYLELEGMNFKTRVIYSVYKEYQERLRKNNAMDFDDLLRYALHVLRDNKEILCNYQNVFQYIMVDEYQDTNHIQYQIVKLLSQAHQNICVVGDDDQCIYEWRGADIRNILDFEKDFPRAKVIKLEQNYRSCGNILDAAHSVIRNNRGRKQKRLWTEAEKGHKIVYTRLDNDKEEAHYVAREIQLLKGPNRRYDDFAILYRTNAQSRLFEDALRRANIPYQILSGFSFYERKETKDMISYMRLVVNPQDEMSFLRVINEPKRGIGAKTIEKLRALSLVRNESMMETISNEEIIASLPKKSQESIREMVNIITMCREQKEQLRVSDVYDALMVKTGYMKALEDENTVEAEGRIENLLDFKSFIYDFEKEKQDQGEVATVEEFLERVATNGDADKFESESGKVALMTMHSSKGLEFPVVFMPGMEDNLFPSHRSMDSEEKLEEERRLCYVGMTRAKERLFLTSAAYRVMYGQGDYARESVFLRELDSKLLDEAGDTIYQPTRRTNNSVGVSTGTLDGFAEPAYKPYDPLAQAKKLAKANAGATGDNIVAGDTVRHGKFGVGIVIEADEKTITVMFETEGRKKLAKGFAPLKKL